MKMLPASFDQWNFVFNSPDTFKIDFVTPYINEPFVPIEKQKKCIWGKYMNDNKTKTKQKKTKKKCICFLFP